MFEIAVTSSLNQLDKYRVDPPPLFIFHITKNHNSQPHTYKFAIYWLIKYLCIHPIYLLLESLLVEQIFIEES